MDSAKEARSALNDSQRNLDSRVKAVWRRTQGRHVSAGILAFCRWGIPMFLIGMAIDWLAHLPAPGRVAILVILLGVSLCKAWRAGWRHVRLFNPVRTALQIEEHHGELESLLVAAIQFRAAESAHGTRKRRRLCALRRSLGFKCCAARQLPRWFLPPRLAFLLC